jgi:hypothetical protein
LSEIDRNCAPDGATEEDDALLRDPAGLGQMGETRSCIGVDAILGGLPLAQPVSPVVEQQDVDSELHEFSRIGEAVRRVPRVSVEEEERAGCSG